MHTHRGFCLPIFSTMQFAPCFFHAVLAHVGQSSCLVSSRPPVRFRQTAPSQRAVRPLPLPHHVAVFSKPQFFEKKKSRKTLRFKRSFAGFLELLTWFEQATCSLRVSCSTSWATVAHCTSAATGNILPYFCGTVKAGFPVSGASFCKAFHKKLLHFSPAAL